MTYLVAWYQNRAARRRGPRRPLTLGLRMTPAAPGPPGPVGVVASSPPPGTQIEIPLELGDGGKLVQITIPAGTTAGVATPFELESDRYDWMDLQVIGIKVVAFLRAPLLGADSGVPYAPPLVSAVDPRSQCAVVLRSAMVHGSLNMLPDRQVVNLGGPFGASNEVTFSGLRLQDVMWANGKTRLHGEVVPAFPVDDVPPAAYDVAIRASLLVNLLRDFRRDPPRRYYHPHHHRRDRWD